jgi:8-oxo-dGTP pyrophosphatase MutT (NUDIX family)
MTGRDQLLARLRAHTPFNAHEAAMRRRLIEFVSTQESCFARSLLVGHVTASAWVVDRDRTYTLLTHHAKLDEWLQMGGHCDGDPDVLGVAFREVEEESGLVDVIPLFDGAIFDVDAHEIPARGAEPQHVHYDVRFLFEADRATPLQLSDESHDLRWIPLDQVAALNTDESVLRMVAKTPRLRR